VHGRILGRLLCHCLICQDVYQLPFADVTVLRATSVTIDSDAPIDFRTYRRPPALNRGRCAHCRNPVLGLIAAPGLKLAFIPSAAYPDASPLPRPAFHIFYHRSRADHPDQLRKYSGYLPSQLAVTGLILRGLLAK
jgi:hypothetical protein